MKEELSARLRNSNEGQNWPILELGYDLTSSDSHHTGIEGSLSGDDPSTIAIIGNIHCRLT